MTKAELRKLSLQQRKQLSAGNIELYSQQICNSFFSSFNLQTVRYLHVYLPIQRLQEVNTWLIIHRLQAEYCHIRIAIPKTNSHDLSMESYVWDEHLLLKENKWGITEPAAGNLVTAQDIDMILMPLLGFDEKGYRAGYGKGYYDRFLEKCNKDIIKIGLCCLTPVSRITDVNSFDIRMDYCITPDKVWQFGRD